MNSSEKLPTSRSSVMYGLKGGATFLARMSDQLIPYNEDTLSC